MAGGGPLPCDSVAAASRIHSRLRGGLTRGSRRRLTPGSAAENPERHIYWVDPGDMNTQMLQEAYPGEDVSDRPLPEVSVTGFLALIAGPALPSGRYAAREIQAGPA